MVLEIELAWLIIYMIHIDTLQDTNALDLWWKWTYSALLDELNLKPEK